MAPPLPAARVLAGLFGASGALALLWLVLAETSQADVPSGLAVVVVVIALASALLARGERPLPGLAVDALGVIVIVAVTISLIAFGQDSPFALFYVWIAPAVVLLAPRGHARWHLALIAAAYGVALALTESKAPGLRSDGSLWLVTIGAVVAAGTLVRLLIRATEDVTRRAQRAADRQGMVARLGQQALAEPLGTRELMRAATAALAEGLEVDYAEALSHRPDDGGLVLLAGHGWPEDLVDTVVVLDGDGFPASRFDIPVAVDDLADDPSLFGPGPLLAQGARAAMVMAVPGGCDRTEALGVRTRERRTFDSEDRVFLASIANVVGAAIERERSERELLRQGLFDPLTGCPNRVLFEDRLEVALGWARATDDEMVAVICLDLDHFGLVNEAHGHGGGDGILGQVPSRLAAILPDATVARIGGDQFAVLVQGVTDVRSAYSAAQQAGRALSEPFAVPGPSRPLTASMGVVVAGADERDAGAVIRDAEAAMRRAKQRSPGAIEIYDLALRKEMRKRMRVEEEMREALERGELRVHYQPLVSLEDGQVVGAEALVRWQHPERGLLEPAEFIPHVEGTPLVKELGEWVLRQACRTLAAWQPHLTGWRFRVSVNVSVTQLEDEDFPARVRQILVEEGADPWRVALELTESAILSDSARTAAAVGRLRQLGLSVVLDDFGTGHASLERIRLLQLDAIKLDHSFVSGLGVDPSDEALVAAAMAMSEALGLDVIAEGIETREQESALMELGCATGQGFRYARAVPPEVLEQIVSWNPARRENGIEAR